MSSDPTSGKTPPLPPTPKEFNPEDYRMTLGEHLEELRHRIILGLAGFIVVLGVCMAYAQRITTWFCAPVVHALVKKHLSPSLVYTHLTDSFMVPLQIAMVCSVAIAGPWILYQLWQFVAAGLYPKERKYVTRYMPLSILLLIAGMAFVYFLVLPVTTEVLIDYGNGVPLPADLHSGQVATTQSAPPMIVPQLDGDPQNPAPFQIWFNKLDGRLKMFVDGQANTIPFQPAGLLAPLFNLSDYIDLVFRMLLLFGLCFQTPLVVLALAKIGIVDVAFLKKYRRPVWFVLIILAALVAPGDLVTAMLALWIPLVLLYEFGVYLAWRSEKQAAQQPTD